MMYSQKKYWAGVIQKAQAVTAAIANMDDLLTEWLRLQDNVIAYKQLIRRARFGRQPEWSARPSHYAAIAKDETMLYAIEKDMELASVFYDKGRAEEMRLALDRVKTSASKLLHWN